MSTDKIDPSEKDVAAVSGELTEQQLNSVTGGDSKTTKTSTDKPREFIEITMSDIIISNH
jgi:hypothetical protein